MYRNGRWRSKWSLGFSQGQNECQLTGLIKVQVKCKHRIQSILNLSLFQVHYFEDGNVQLVSSKDITETIEIEVKNTSKSRRYVIQ